MIDPRQRVAVVSQGSFDSDPRHLYWSASLRALGCEVVEVEIIDQGCPAWLRASARMHGCRWTVSTNRFATTASVSRPPVETSTGRYLASSDRLVCEAIDLLTPVLSEMAMVVAIDLLVARNVLSHLRETPVVYDAHEVFVESYDMLDTAPLSDVERRYWRAAERDVANTAVATIAVSPGIAEFMRIHIDVSPTVIPNYLPVNLGRQREHLVPVGGPVRFVFVGRADPHRGLEQLVTSWDFAESFATLDLYIPDSPHKKRLQSLSHGVRRTHASPVFRTPVDPANIPETLGMYHVGIIPYDYPHPYSEASPNKFGEYVAAGLAVISNGSGFVSRKVSELSLGKVFDWTVPNSFALAVEGISESLSSGRVRYESEIAFRQEMNWESASGALLTEIGGMLRSMPASTPSAPPVYLRSRGRWSSVILTVVLRPAFELIRRSARARSVANFIYRVVRTGRRLPPDFPRRP